MCASDCQLINCCAYRQLSSFSSNIVSVEIDIIKTHTQTLTHIHRHILIKAWETTGTTAYKPNETEAQLNLSAVHEA